MDELIKVLVTIVALVVLSGISSWMRKRELGDQGKTWPDETSAPRPRSQPPPLRPRRPGPTPPVRPQPSWEEELRRLLQGEPEPPPPPPPLVIQETQPAPVQETAPVMPARVYRTAEAESEEGPHGEMAAMAESKRAHERALQIHEQTFERLKHAAESATPPAIVMRRTVLAPDIQDLVRGLHTRPNARRAFVASLVFSPPKAFES